MYAIRSYYAHSSAHNFDEIIVLPDPDTYEFVAPITQSENDIVDVNNPQVSELLTTQQSDSENGSDGNNDERVDDNA